MGLSLLAKQSFRAGALSMALCVGVVGSVSGMSAPAYAKAAPASFADLAERLSPAVVNISTSQMAETRRRGPVPGLPEGSPFGEFFDEFLDRDGPSGKGKSAPRKVQSLGSGFVIDAKGIIITNNHVIAKADEITVNFPDGTKLPAEVIGTDPKTDIAVLRVKPTTDLVAVKFGKSDKSRVGDWVIAIGNPFGLGGTVTAGIISAINRDINAGPYDDFIQTDASINRGNSGGPLFNMDGDVIGVNTAIISPSGGSIGIGFSVPSAIALPVIEQLQSFGETRRGWLGVKIQGVTDEIAEGLGMDEAKGALVAGVTEGGPAADAKLESGDVIVEFDGRDVPEMRDLPRMVAETEIGRDVHVVVIRDGKRKKLSVTLGRLEEAEEKELADSKDEKENKDGPITLGMSLSKIDDEARRRHNIGEGTDGVLVVAVDPASFAATQGLRAGDVIVEVAKEAVSSPKEVKKIVAEQKEKGRKSVLLLVSSTGDMRFVAVRIEEKE